MADESPKVFGSYEVLSLLKKGIAGCSYTARQVTTNKIVFLKIFEPIPQSSTNLFERELKNLDKLRGIPGILFPIDSGNCEGKNYIVREFIGDGSLRDLLVSRRPKGLGVDEGLELFAQIADTIDKIHARGGVYWDLKPENVLLRKLDTGHQILLTDFELSHIVDITGKFQTHSDIGNPEYWAPEDLSKIGGDHTKEPISEYTQAVDIYKLGVMFYEALEGTPPFTGSCNEIISKVLREDPTHPENIERKSNRQVADAVLSALNKDPDKRPRSAEVYINSVRDALNDDHWVIGHLIGKYRVEELLSDSDISTMVKARHVHSHELAAIKLFRLPSVKDVKQSYESELSNLLKLEGNIGIRLPREKGKSRGMDYLVYDFMDGGNLRSLFSCYPDGMEPEQALKLFIQIAQTLDCVHDNGIVHLDIKPENIVLNNEGGDKKPYITDFGLSKYLKGKSKFITERIRGTDPYLAPEGWRSNTPQTKARDIYALAIMVYEALEGKLPFMAESTEALMQEHLTCAVPYPHKTSENISSEAAEIVLKALSKKPEDRPKAAGDFIRGLYNANQNRLMIGHDFSHYQIVQLHGESRTGTTYKATDNQSGDTVAIKIFPEFTLYPHSTEAFDREVKILSKLKPRGFGNLRDFGTWDRRHFIVVDYLEGESLRSLLTKNTFGMSVAKTLKVFEPLADQIDHIHEKGIVHRNIKPENVLLQEGEQEKPRLVDFGLARIFGNEPTFRTKTFSDNFSYIAPEAWADEDLTPAVDIYAFGTMMYEALEGHLPYGGMNVKEEHLQDGVPKPRKIHMLAGSEAANLLLETLEKDPKNRPAKAKIFLKDFRKSYQKYCLKMILWSIGIFLALAAIFTPFAADWFKVIAGWTDTATPTAETAIPTTSLPVLTPTDVFTTTTPSGTQRITPSATLTGTSTQTATPTDTATPTSTGSATATNTRRPTWTPTRTPSPTNKPIIPTFTFTPIPIPNPLISGRFTGRKIGGDDEYQMSITNAPSYPRWITENKCEIRFAACGKYSDNKYPFELSECNSPEQVTGFSFPINIAVKITGTARQPFEVWIQVMIEKCQGGGTFESNHLAP